MAQATTHKEGILATLLVLGGDKKTIDPETLTVGCFKAFPSLFSMDLFKEYPRMDRITKRISDLINDNLIQEKIEGKYQLTEKGIELCKNNTELIRVAESAIFTELENIQLQNLSDEEISREKSKLKRSEAYKKAMEHKLEELTVADFMDFLRVDIYTTKQLFERRLKKIRAICQNDKELNRIYEYLAKRFGEDYSSFKREMDKLLKVN